MQKIVTSQVNKYDLKHKCYGQNYVIKVNAYIVVRGIVNVTDPNNNGYDKKLDFKNNAPFISCISTINDTLNGNGEDLDIVMPMYKLNEYSKSY